MEKDSHDRYRKWTKKRDSRISSMASKRPQYNMSLGGEHGFDDIGTMIWLRHSHLGTKVVTPKIWTQIEKIMQYLENTGTWPSTYELLLHFFHQHD